MSDDRPRIVIVDDREQNRYVLCRILTQAGYDCTEIGSGFEALAAAKTLPDIMILDVQLPDISGYEVCRRIKADPLTAQISVLQISASFVSSLDKTRALEVGADGYLTHPIDGMVLAATVRSLLRLRAAEAVALKSAEQWQSTFNALSEGLALIDAEGRLVRWNGAFVGICDSKCPIAPGDGAAALLERLLGTSEPLQHDGEDVYRAEFQVEDRTVQLTVNLVNTQSPGNGKILVLSDVTDRKLAEYAIRTAEKLAATGKLANAIAHEINNPLEALTNLIYLAGTSTSLETIQGLLIHANQELARIARITKQTLSFHRDTHHPVVLDVGGLVKDVVAVIEKSAAARRVRLVCEQRPTLAIYGFPGQLSQVFINLVRNAAEAAPPDSEVLIRVRSIHRSGREGARVTIHDRGSGIPPDVRKKMFDPFFTTKELKGSGLGLWVSKNLVTKHEGTVRFRSSTRPGSSGTTFEVFLPVGGLLPNSLRTDES